MTWLVTGGAGYIGAHVVRAFRQAGIDVVVVDSLASGRSTFVPAEVPLVKASVLDAEIVRNTIVEHEVVGVVHLAGFKYAGVSVEKPLLTYEQNVTGTVRLLEAMHETGVDKMVFSSSAAIFGTPDVEIVDEQTPKDPESPYAESKLIGEWLMRDAERAHGLRHVSLRYFNVVGSAAPHLYDTSPHNLFPKVLDSLAQGRQPQINGDDYPTPDGTNVRDYIHVADIAETHVAAAEALSAGRELAAAYNLGSGHGISVREIMTAIASVTGLDVDPTIAARRPGDPARIVSSGELAARDLGWTMRYDLTDMVRSAWEARLYAASVG